MAAVNTVSTLLDQLDDMVTILRLYDLGDTFGSFKLNATFANSGNSCVLLMKPSSPPRDAEPGSSEYKRANVENSILPELTCSVKSRKRALIASVSSNGIFGSKVTICTSTVVGMFGRLS